jgi:hypothetical protein
MTPPTPYPNFLTHYYETTIGPFINLSDLPLAEAEAILDRLRRDPTMFAARRPVEYLPRRREIEDRLRVLFIDRGGQPRRARPHYMILGECPWLKSWYPHGGEIRLPLTAFHRQQISFTYGDSFPTFRLDDGQPYRRRVYLLADLPTLIETYGLPQDRNPDGATGPDRYIEAQIWDDAPLRRASASRHAG